MEYHTMFKGKHRGKTPWQSPGPLFVLSRTRNGEMVQWVTVVAYKPGDLSSDLWTHDDGEKWLPQVVSDTSEIISRQNLLHCKGSEQQKQPLEKETYLEVIHLFLMVWQFRKISCYFCFTRVLGCTTFHFPHLQNDLITYGILDFLTYVLAYTLSF